LEIDVVLEVEPGDPQIAIDFLVANINLSKSRLKDLMNKGGVWRVSHDGTRQRLRRAMSDILVGEQIEIFYDEALLSLKPMRPQLVDDFIEYSIWNKPYGMPLVGNDWGDFNALERILEQHLQPERDIFWLSSFDYEAAGLILIAHTRKAAATLSSQFDPAGFNGAEVCYRCDVVGDFLLDGEIELDVDGEPAISMASKVRYDERPDRSVVDVWPKTGRLQQVRKQLSDLEYPVVGDEDFGLAQDENELLRMKIIELKFKCPVSGKNQHISLMK
jgi:tRNA pseudouridine32 synthase / 23S rRNA pseudouridine746 synthase